MSKLEDLRPNAAVRGILPDGPVTVVSAQWFGSEALELTYKTATGKVANELLYRHDEPRLDIVEQGRPWSFDGDGHLFRLVSEAHRIRLAHLFDPVLAVHTAMVEPLPHQITAVYDSMLPRQPLRFLLADDPGAGKTIMAGLLLKELKLRGAVERILILAPAPLTLQWQDELRSKFDEVFERIDVTLARDQLGGSPWARFPQCVASLDFAKQDHVMPDLLRQRWDLVIVDEAHKVAMPDADKPTKRFRLVRQLAERTESLLFLTATPHQGNPAQFRNLLSLLDEHVFRSEQAVQKLLREPESPWLAATDERGPSRLRGAEAVRRAPRLHRGVHPERAGVGALRSRIWPARSPPRRARHRSTSRTRRRPGPSSVSRFRNASCPGPLRCFS